MKRAITGPTWDGILHVALNMREKDRAEIFACRWQDSALGVAEDTIAAKDKGVVYIGWLDANPVVVYGAQPLRPGVWSAFAYATDDFADIGAYVTRHIRRAMMPGLVLMGAHRAQCYSLATHTVAHRWLEALGAHREAEVSAFGKNGEDFVLFSWTEKTFDVHGRRAGRQ
jgi:hypothetical protein